MKKSIYSERQARLGQLLRAARKKAGIKQVALTKRLGKYKTFVSKYESGERRLDVIEFIEVAEAIGVNPAELVRKIVA